MFVSVFPAFSLRNSLNTTLAVKIQYIPSEAKRPIQTNACTPFEDATIQHGQSSLRCAVRSLHTSLTFKYLSASSVHLQTLLSVWLEASRSAVIILSSRCCHHHTHMVGVSANSVKQHLDNSLAISCRIFIYKTNFCCQGLGVNERLVFHAHWWVREGTRTWEDGVCLRVWLFLEWGWQEKRRRVKKQKRKDRGECPEGELRTGTEQRIEEVRRWGMKEGRGGDEERLCNQSIDFFFFYCEFSDKNNQF